MECPPGKIFNQASYRCVDINGKTGQLIRAVLDSKEDLFSGCPPNRVRNPAKSGRPCIFVNTRDGEIITETLKYKKRGRIECPEKQVFDPVTGRCVSVTGRRGREIVGRWSCLKYGRAKRLPFTPREHQTAVANYFVNSNLRGILLYWSLGTGKTCGAALLVDRLLSRYGEKKVYVLSTGSLRENFIYEYCMVCGEDPLRISRLFDFIAYNYIDVQSLLPSREEMEDSIIVIDEVHNLVTGYSHGSDNYVAVTELLMSLKNARFILLSGTPITNSVDDLYHILKLIKPEAIPTLDDFNNYFFITEEGVPVPSEKLRGIISDVISRVVATTDPGDYPDVIPIYVTVPMSEPQYAEYQRAVSFESRAFQPKEELRDSDPEAYRTQVTRYVLAVTMMSSQQVCNMIYPPDISYHVQREKRRRGQAPPDRLVSDGGWIDKNFIDNLDIYFPKMLVLLQYMKEIPGKHVVYSRFLKRHGVMAIEAILNYYGIRTLKFIGMMNDEERSQVLNLFNSIDNMEGEQYKVLLMTEAGSEGQNFLHVRAIHIMEQYVNEFDIQQAIGRVIRYHSHFDLPVDEQNVTVIRYFAVTPGEPVPFDAVPDERVSSDIRAYDRASAKMTRITPLLDMLDTLPIVPSTSTSTRHPG